ncbi:MAG: hypothetical protein FWC66_10025 [Oscillospiraceae bacterium]|nr:hypothetical protein [Oscillospiraceae bacterium]
MDNHEALAKMNQVEGFNPLDFARTIISTDGQPSLYLDVKHRVAWFRLKYPLGKISKTITQLDEKMAIVECRIYKEASDSADAYFANGFGQRYLETENAYGSRYLEWAETAAIGRALSAAGFNIATGSEIDDEAGQVDSGVPIADNAKVSVSNPLNKQQKNEHPVNAPLSSYKQDSPVDEILRVMPLDKAKQIVVPFNGKNQGKTLAQVAIDDPSTLGWIVSNYSGPNNELRAAAKLLLNASTQNAA